jgi:rhodanese-related sulfurtransferase
MFSPSQPAVPSVTPAELDPARPVPADAVLVDVREADEWAAGHAPDAVHIPLGELTERLGELPEADRLLLICHSGVRSGRATAWLVQNGYDAVNVDGGMVDWARAGLPVV